MKRVSLWMIGIGLCITVGLITVEPGYAEEKDDDTNVHPENAERAVSVRRHSNAAPTSSEQQSLLAVAGYHISMEMAPGQTS